MFRVCCVQGLLCLGFVVSTVCYVQHLLCLGFVTSSVCYVQGLLCPGFVVSRVCYVQGLSFQGSVISSVCCVQGLLCLLLVCLGFVCLGLVMVLIIDYIRHFFQANTFTCKHTHTQTRPPTKTLFLWQKMPNSIFLVRKSCTLRLLPPPSVHSKRIKKFLSQLKSLCLI